MLFYFILFYYFSLVLLFILSFFFSFFVFRCEVYLSNQVVLTLYNICDLFQLSVDSNANHLKDICLYEVCLFLFVGVLFYFICFCFFFFFFFSLDSKNETCNNANGSMEITSKTTSGSCK
jgi:hypothetical protein